MIRPEKGINVWAVTETGARLGGTLCRSMGAALCLPDKPWSAGVDGAFVVPSLQEGIARCFHEADGHIFIMATGIVVRMIAPHLVSKAEDPAVVVMDEAGRFAVSLVSGHIGGANRLAEEAARIAGAVPVITTATDIHGIPSVDGTASERGLVIENPEAVKGINMSLLEKRTPAIWDPMGFFADMEEFYVPVSSRADADVVVDCSASPAGDGALLVRPKVISAGVGCRRGACVEEVMATVETAFRAGGLSLLCLGAMATIDLKFDEEGLVEAAKRFNVPLSFYTRNQLGEAKGIVFPSTLALKYVGVESVCEAAAILRSNAGPLLVPKVKSGNVTAALAMDASIS